MRGKDRGKRTKGGRDDGFINHFVKPSMSLFFSSFLWRDKLNSTAQLASAPGEAGMMGY